MVTSVTGDGETPGAVTVEMIVWMEADSELESALLVCTSLCGVSWGALSIEDPEEGAASELESLLSNEVICDVGDIEGEVLVTLRTAEEEILVEMPGT